MDNIGSFFMDAHLLSSFPIVLSEIISNDLHFTSILRLLANLLSTLFVSLQTVFFTQVIMLKIFFFLDTSLSLKMFHFRKISCLMSTFSSTPSNLPNLEAWYMGNLRTPSDSSATTFWFANILWTFPLMPIQASHPEIDNLTSYFSAIVSSPTMTTHAHQVFCSTLAHRKNVW